LLQDLSRFGETWKSWQLVGCIASAAREDELQAVLGPALEAMSDAPMGVPDKVELEGEMKSPVFRGTAPQSFRLAGRLGAEPFPSIARNGCGAALFLL